MPHFPTPSPKPEKGLREILKKSDGRLKGRLLPVPVDGQVSLSSIFSTCLIKKDFPLDLSALIQDGRMGLTFRQFDEMSRRVAKLLGEKVAQIISNLNPVQTSQDAPTNYNGDSVIGILTDGKVDERILVYLVSILKLGATYVNIRKDDIKSPEDWKMIVRRVQPLIIMNVDDAIEINANLLLSAEESLLSKNASSGNNFWMTKTICSLNTEAGKKKLPLPYFVLNSNEIWEQAIQLKEMDNVIPLRLKTQIGERAAIIFPYVISGTITKWIRMGHRIIHNRIYWEKAEFPVQEAERFYLTYPLSDPRALVQLFLPLCIGKPVNLVDPEILCGKFSQKTDTDASLDEDTNKIEQLLNQILHFQMHRISISPEKLEKLLDFAKTNERQRDLSGIKNWMVSGGSFTLDLGRKFFNCFSSEKKSPSVTFLFGCPEVLWSATWATYTNYKDMQKRSVNNKICVGTPLYNLLITVLDDKNWAECPLSTKGEICINVPSVQADTIDFIQTGDLGRIVKDKGIIKVLILEGKTSTRVKVKGKTIDLVELAETIVDAKIVSNCMAFIAPRTKDVQTIVVAYVPKNELGPDNKIQIEKSIQSIEPLVSACIPIKEMPLNSKGQTDFKALRKHYHEFLTECEFIDWSSLMKYDQGERVNATSLEIACAKALIKSVATSIGQPASFVIDKIEDSFWNITNAVTDAETKATGISQATKAARAILSTQTQGFVLTPEDIIVSESLKILARRMAFARSKEALWKKEVAVVHKLIKYEPLKLEHWELVMNLLKIDFDSNANMFSAGSLERFWKRALDDIIKEGLSVVAFVDKELVGCALNCRHFPKSEYLPANMSRIFGLIYTSIDTSKWESFSQPGVNLLKSFYIAVAGNVLDEEGCKLMVMKELFQKSWNLGLKIGKCDAFLVCTANPLAQETVCLLNYKTLLELPMNRYKTQKLEKPFWDKDDHEKIGVYLKTQANR